MNRKPENREQSRFVRVEGAQVPLTRLETKEPKGLIVVITGPGKGKTTTALGVSPDLTISQLVHDYFLHYAYGGFPVLADGRVLGVVTIAGARQVPRQEQDSRKVAEVMVPSGEPLVISADLSLADALRQMTREEQDRLLVMEQDRLVGLITKSSLLRFVQVKRILEPEELTAG